MYFHSIRNIKFLIMAHFAKLNENNEVIKVIVVGEEEVSHNGDPAGEAYCTKLFGGTWKQTSYNTKKGVHYNSDGTVSEDQSKAFRWNYAGIGFTYDESLDSFIPPKPYSSWTLVSKEWVAPVAEPSSFVDASGNNIMYDWNEDNQQWIGNPMVDGSVDLNITYTWNPNTSSWS